MVMGTQIPPLRRIGRWPLGMAGGLLTLAVFVAGVGFAAAMQNDEPQKEKPKTEEPKKERDDKDKTKKTDADKEIDELVEEMTQNLPPGTEASAATRMREQLRENLRNLPAEQRKQMLATLRRRNLGGAALPGGVPMPPGIGGQRYNGRLGARVEPPSATLVEQLDLPNGQGLVVREVLPNSAAAKAGLKPHDVLVEFHGKPVPNRVEEFARLLADIKPDTVVELVVLRKGKKETIKDVKLPEVKAIPPVGPGVFPPGRFPQPPGGFNPPRIGSGSSVVTTMVRTAERFTLRHQEGSLIITLTGKMADGKPKIQEIHVQDGGRSETYENVDKVPDRYRTKITNLIEMCEKGSVRIEIKSP
jgi:hypothetical protein